ETGTGKDLVAKAIHNNSRRKNKRMAILNCAAPNESLIEDELFGHDPGAYTGGEKARKGMFEYANGGTILLDEIGDMPFKLHGKHVTTIADPVRRAMLTYEWPGNVRELRHFIESMVVLDYDGVLGIDDAQDSPVLQTTGSTAVAVAGGVNLIGRPLAAVERYF